MIGKTNVGGGGSFAKAGDAVLAVEVPTGSTVTLTKGGVVKRATGWVDTESASSIVFLFPIKASTFDSDPWTISASNGTEAATQTVVINASGLYRAALSYVLPAGYQRVSYVESSGGQYVDTGIKGSDIGKICINGRMTSSTAYMSLFGVCNKGLVTNALETGNTIAYIPASGKFYVNNHGAINGTALATDTDFEIEAEITSSIFRITVNGTTTSSASGTVGSISAKNLYLFACNYNGSNAGGVSARVSEVQIYDKSTEPILLANLIPCVNTSDASVGGFYDTVNAIFIAGSDGALTPGPRV